MKYAVTRRWRTLERNKWRLSELRGAQSLSGMRGEAMAVSLAHWPSQLWGATGAELGRTQRKCFRKRGTRSSQHHAFLQVDFLGWDGETILSTVP